MELEPEPEPERVAAGAFAPLRKRLAKLDADYKLSEKAAAASKIAAERAAAAAAAAAAGATQAAVAVENYRKGVAPLPPDMKKIRVATVKECFLRSTVVQDIVTSFLAEPATSGSESVRHLTTILKHLTHGSAEWKASMAESIAVAIPPKLRGRDVKAAMREQMMLALNAAMVDAQIEVLHVKMSSNRAAADKLKSDLDAVDSLTVTTAESPETDGGVLTETVTPLERKLKISLDLLKINSEEREYTTELKGLLEAKAKIQLNENQSECDKVIASTKELYAAADEEVQDKKESIGENKESVDTEKELAEMQYLERDGQIQKELEELRAQEAELTAELTKVQDGIAALEAQRAEAAAARDSTTAKVVSIHLQILL
eukprot:SAG31_NODE_1323_length_8792_cov_16.597032_2_plen_374_part_00